MGQVGSILEIENYKDFLEQELNFVIKNYKMIPTNESEEIDIIV